MRANRLTTLLPARLTAWAASLVLALMCPVAVVRAQNAPMTPGSPSGYPMAPPLISAPTDMPPPPAASATTPDPALPPPFTPSAAVPSLPPLQIPENVPVTPGALAALRADDPLLQPYADLALPPPGLPPPPPESRLDEILAYAATFSNTMRAQKDTVAQFDAARFRSWVRNMPAINGTYNVGLFYQATHTSSSNKDLLPGGAFAIQLTHPLWAWGAYDATRDLAFLKERIAQNTALITYARLCLDLRRLYYELSVSKSEVALRASQLHTANLRLENELILFRNQRSTRSQVDRLELDRDNLALKKLSADTEHDRLLRDFRRLSGMSGFADADVPADIYLPVVNHEELEIAQKDFEARGFDVSPVALENNLARGALEQQIIIARAQQKPQFNFSAGLTQTPLQNTTNNSLQFSTILFVGVAGTWNIFDRFETRDKVRALYNEKRVAEIRLRDAREQAFNDSSSSMSQIFIGLHALAILKRQLSRTQRDYENVLILRANGRAGQTLLDSARDNLLQVRHEILTRRAEVANSYYTFLSALFRDPALIHLPEFALPSST